MTTGEGKLSAADKGLIFEIRRFTLHDGPGIRSTVFFKGCPLACIWCHNPESQADFPEESVKSVKLDSKSYFLQETAGIWMSVEEIFEEVSRDRIFYEESGGGISLSGGEPLAQPGFLMALLKKLKNGGFHVALDTCGHAEWEILEETLNYVDLYLYDLKLMNATLHESCTGVANSMILENFRRLSALTGNIQVRIPVIEGLSASEANMMELLAFLKPFRGSVRGISLLPFHSLAAGKYHRFLKENRLAGMKNMRAEDLEPMKTMLINEGFNVTIGG